MRLSSWPWLRWVLVLVFSSVACRIGCAQFIVSAQESFDYSAGTLAGNNGGTGWTSAWAHNYGSGSSLNVSSSGLSYSGLTVTGGSAVWGSGGNGISEGTRSLSRMDSGVVYLQFLSQFGSTSGGGTPNIRLYDSGALTGGVGGNGGSYGSYMSILDTSLSPASDGSSSSSASLSAENFTVVRIDYVNTDTKMWVNPDLATFDYSNPTSPDATYTGLAPAFDTIAIYSRSPATIDEIRVLTAVPEPEETAFLSASLLLMAGLGIRIRRARRRNAT